MRVSGRGQRPPPNLSPYSIDSDFLITLSSSHTHFLTPLRLVGEAPCTERAAASA